MIEAVILITAMIVILRVTTLAVESARMNARLNHIDELVKRGFDVGNLMKEMDLRD